MLLIKQIQNLYIRILDFGTLLPGTAAFALVITSPFYQKLLFVFFSKL